MHGILQIGIITFFCHSLYVVFLRHQSMKAGKSMKKRFVSLLVALSITLTFLPIGAVAATPIRIGNLKYTVNADGESVTVSGTSGNPTQLNIESSISSNGRNYTVTEIATWAFNKCNTLTEVTLPNTVDEIGYQAFFNCSNLTNVTIPEGVTKIGQAAFYGCSQLTSITIPSTITDMDTAFSGNTALSQVTLTNGIPKISSHAFERCTELREIKVPISVDEICPFAFNGCTGLTSVTLEKGINIINSNAFKDCTELNDVKYNGYKTDWEKVRVNNAGNDTLTSKVQYLCDINFDLDGGTINGSDTMATQTVYSNEKLGTAKCYPNDQPFVVPTDPVREGYTFLGWYTQAEGGIKYTFTEAVSSNITLYAHWNAHSHTVTLENDENKETNSYDYGSSVSVPTPTKKTGYNFNHWEVTVPDGETAPSLNGPDENGNYSFSMPDYDIILTAKWTQKDVIDPDVDLKFDAVTGEVTSNNAKVNADDIINKKFYDDKGNEVPGEKLNDRGLPTEPGDYIVKVDVKETENTAPANQVTGNQIKWSYNVPQKEEKVTYTLSLLGGIAKVNGKDTTINDNGDITIEKGATVEVTFDRSILSDAQTFDQWTIKPASVLNAVDPKAETITFTMPGENVIIEAMTKDASIEEEPNILGTTLIIGTAAAGTAVLAYQTYQLGTEFYLICALPTGTAIPTNRGELAELVWNNAGKPEPAAVLNANATETDKAIAWAVENDLLKAAKNNGETYEATDPVSRTEVIKAWNQVQAFKK
ncbi:leucine-rich repeat protein [Faecalibacterium prausnitzii]|uniref:leucine-rich repeat protein n=2 Tax=Faecalibacterium TaxID=216851 RepID=UPI0012DCCD28|nr:leucine-rich repeat protein [Faecalibacterium prausnitzii]